MLCQASKVLKGTCKEQLYSGRNFCLIEKLTYQITVAKDGNTNSVELWLNKAVTQETSCGIATISLKWSLIRKVAECRLLKSAVKKATELADSLNYDVLTCFPIVKSERDNLGKDSWVIAAKINPPSQVEQLCTWINPEETLNPSANYAPSRQFSVKTECSFFAVEGDVTECVKLLNEISLTEDVGATVQVYNHNLATLTHLYKVEKTGFKLVIDRKEVFLNSFHPIQKILFFKP